MAPGKGSFLGNEEDSAFHFSDPIGCDLVARAAATLQQSPSFPHPTLVQIPKATTAMVETSLLQAVFNRLDQKMVCPNMWVQLCKQM